MKVKFDLAGRRARLASEKRAVEQADYIRRLVDSAPPFTRDQADLLLRVGLLRVKP